MVAHRIRVLIVEDEKLLRKLTANYLKMQDDILVVGQSGDGRSAFKSVEANAPDIVLMDVALPQMSGDVVTRRILSCFPTIRILAFSGWDDRAVVARMIQAGARGYVLKSASPEDMIDAIRAVHRGGTYYSPELVERFFPALWLDLPRVTSTKMSMVSVRSDLTPREQQVVQLVAEGHRTRGIAQSLGLTERTVSKYRERIMEKLDLHSVAELTKYAVRNGLTPLI